jgi:hypothetical protein
MAGLPAGAAVSPAKNMPLMATVGTAWFSTMSTMMPLGRTRRVVREAKVPVGVDFVSLWSAGLSARLSVFAATG